MVAHGIDEKVVRFSVSVPPSLLSEFDAVARSIGSTRSRAVQVALRSFIRDYRLTHAKNGFVVGSINVVYNHEVRGLDEWLTGLQHDHLDVIVSSLHVHLNEEKCLLVIVVKGDLKVIKGFIRELMRRRGIDQVRFAAVLS